MKLKKNIRGAVSIFLIIVLLPVITIAGLFIDVSRTNLSQEVVMTSSDLALNTVLSEYDKNLKDYYGILASCQDTSEVIAASKQFFVDSMVSTGVAVSEAQVYADEVISAFVGDKDIRDMLQLSINGEAKIEPCDNGAINNPALLKKSIIDFMKYRAPINGVAELFKKITDADIAENVENVSKENKMIEAKKEFYEAEKELIEQAEIAYQKIKEYRNYTTWTGKKIGDEKFLDDMSLFLMSPDTSGNTFPEVIKDYHNKMVMNLCNTHDATGTHSVNLIKKKTISAQAEVNTFSENNKPTKKDIKDLLTSFNSKLYEYYKSKDELKNSWNNVGFLNNTDYQIQYWVELTNKCSLQYSNYVTATENLWKAFNKINNAVKYADEKILADNKMNLSLVTNQYVSFDTPDIYNMLSIKSIYDSLKNSYDSIKNEVTNGGTIEYKYINNQIGIIDNDSNKGKLKLTTVSELYNIRNKVYKYQYDFNKAADKAGKAKAETEKLKSLLSKYRKAFEKWDKAANDPELLSGSKLAEKDRKEILELKNSGIDLFSEESVKELCNRLGNIAKLCKTFKDDLKAIKYKETSIVNISDYTKFLSAANVDLNKVVRNMNELQNYSNNSYLFNIGKKIQRIEIHDNTTSQDLSDGDAYVITDSFHTNIEKTYLELYDWMRKKFDKPVAGTAVSVEQVGLDAHDKSSAKNAFSSLSNMSEEPGEVSTSENLSGHSFSEWSGEELPSKGVGAAEEQAITSKLSEVSNYVSSIFSNFSDTFMGSLVNMRDDLFFEDYAFNMFTYDTFDNEGCYKLLDNSVKNGLKPDVALEKYNEKRADWQNSKENKTLTLTPRNTSNNWVYGGEIEYLLYGNSENYKNKTTAYANIYLIRYALDVVAVFDVYWDDPTLKSLATALQNFAFIPAPLTKTLACLAITAAEAGIDIKYLKAGLPVVLCKKKEDIICNYKSVFMGTGESDTTSNEHIALQYSDYLKIFLFIKLLGNNENVIYTRCADLIQANIALVTNNNQFALSKSQVYYNFQASVIVEPMWSKLLAIDNLGDLSTAKDWRTININLIRGY